MDGAHEPAVALPSPEELRSEKAALLRGLPALPRAPCLSDRPWQPLKGPVGQWFQPQAAADF